MMNFCFIIFLLAFSSCKSDQNQVKSIGKFVVGIKSDPQKIHPFFNPKNSAREVFQNIFLPIADYHPIERTLTPILIEFIPDAIKIGQKQVAFDLMIKEEATWKDGSPITGYDYQFAYQIVMHPQSQSAAWRPYLSIIKDINIDPDNPKKFRVVCDQSSMLAKETVVTFYPVQGQRYDPNQHLRKYAISQWIDSDHLESVIAKDPEITSIIETFNHPDTYRKDIHHAGGYRLDQWETDQYIQLTKVPEFWASQNSTNPYLQVEMDTLLFKIINDGNAMSTLLLDGGIDMTSTLDADQYLALKENKTLSKTFDFIEYEGMRMAYLGLNNRDPELQDTRVRQAIAHSIDVNAIIEAEELGIGRQASVIFHPSRRYYPDAPARTLDINKAKQLLDDAGWKDSNDNGTRDQVINGRSEELILDFYISGSNLSKTIALLLKDGAQKAGYDINVIQKDARSYINDNVNKHDYEIAALLATFDDADDNPYLRWHSDNAGIGGKNRSGFHTPTTDSLIQKIINESDTEKRLIDYRKLSGILYDQVPVIPLYAPVELFVIDHAYTGIATSKRPGYMANTFRLK